MRGLFISTFILFFSYGLLGQETKLITRTGSDIQLKEAKRRGYNTLTIGPSRDFIEEYFVLKNDKNIRHGSYVKYRQTSRGVQVLASGSYENGQENGLWAYYHDILLKNTDNSIKQKGHYVNGKKNGVWTSYYLDTIPEVIDEERFGRKRRADSIKISIDQQSAKLKIAGRYLNDKRVGEWISFTYAGESFQIYDFSKRKLIRDLSITDTLEYNANRNALFIGGLPCLMDFLRNEFSFTRDLVKEMKGDSSSVTVSFIIDTDGSLKDPEVGTSTGNKILEKETLRVVLRAGDNWIPAISEGTTVTSICRIEVSVFQTSLSPTHKQFSVRYNPIFD